MASDFKVGLVATGSAGSQHAIVMANLPGVLVVAGADPTNGIGLFDSTKNDTWYIKGSKWYADESDMLKQEQIDGLIVSADPLAVGSTIKAAYLVSSLRVRRFGNAPWDLNRNTRTRCNQSRAARCSP